MHYNDSIRDAVKQTWRNYIIEPKDWKENYGLAPQNLYNSLFCFDKPQHYSMDSYWLHDGDNARYLRNVFEAVKNRLSDDTKNLINRNTKGNEICIVIVPADAIRYFNRDALENNDPLLHIILENVDDYIHSEELLELLRIKDLKYFPVILSHTRRTITNIIPCITVKESEQ